MAQSITEFKGPWGFLSNFHPVGVCLDDEWYPSVEHAYQAAKTLNLGKRWQIMEATDAAKAKKLGRKLELRENWDTIRLSIMEDLLRQKFKPKTVLANQLLGTKTALLVEGNWWGDRYWGVCQGTGENNLGKLLMKIRSELKEK